VLWIFWRERGGLLPPKTFDMSERLIDRRGGRKRPPRTLFSTVEGANGPHIIISTVEGANDPHTIFGGCNRPHFVESIFSYGETLGGLVPTNQLIGGGFSSINKGEPS